jgi:hypothetical protein
VAKVAIPFRVYREVHLTPEHTSRTYPRAPETLRVPEKIRWEQSRENSGFICGGTVKNSRTEKLSPKLAITLPFGDPNIAGWRPELCVTAGFSEASKEAFRGSNFYLRNRQGLANLLPTTIARRLLGEGELPGGAAWETEDGRKTQGVKCRQSLLRSTHNDKGCPKIGMLPFFSRALDFQLSFPESLGYF